MEPKQTRAQRATAAAKSPWAGAILALMAALTSYLKAQTNEEELARAKQHSQKVQSTLTDNEASLARSANGVADALTMLYQHEANERVRLTVRLEQVERELQRLKASTPAPSPSRRHTSSRPQPDHDSDGVAPDPLEDQQAAQEAAQRDIQAVGQKLMRLPLRPKLKAPEQALDL